MCSSSAARVWVAARMCMATRCMSLRSDLKHYVWFPAAELYGIQRIEYLDNVLVLCGAGVGGGSHVYGNTLYVPQIGSEALRVVSRSRVVRDSKDRIPG